MYDPLNPGFQWQGCIEPQVVELTGVILERKEIGEKDGCRPEWLPNLEISHLQI
jgi:hypothetical protein